MAWYKECLCPQNHMPKLLPHFGQTFIKTTLCSQHYIVFVNCKDAKAIFIIIALSLISIQALALHAIHLGRRFMNKTGNGLKKI